LDGTATLFEDVAPDAGTLRTTARLTGVSRSVGMTLVGFEVNCFLGDRRVFTMTTGFGFFPAKALSSQVGLPPTPEERAAIEEPDDHDRARDHGGRRGRARRLRARRGAPLGRRAAHLLGARPRHAHRLG